MNEKHRPSNVIPHPAAGAVHRVPNDVFPNVYLPKRVYEALPAAYIAIGLLLMLGAAYIGPDHSSMPGYLLVGLLSLFLGVRIRGIRHRARQPNRTD